MQPYYHSNPFGNVMDMFMNNFSDIMKGSYEMTFNNIVKIFVLSQIGSIKQVVPKGIQTVFDNLKKFFFVSFYTCKKQIEKEETID
jgi:hypothetical protein